MTSHSGIGLITSVTKTLGVSEHPIIGAVNSDSSAYIHFIPKNASSYLRLLLAKENWNEVVNADHILNSQYKINQLTILRDPVDRWVSGITQFLFDVFNNVTVVENHWEAIFRIITAQPKQDTHTTSQAEFFSNYNLEHFDFLYLDDDQSIKSKLNGWANLRLNQTFAHLNSIFPVNQTVYDRRKLKISNFVKENLNNNISFKKRIVDYYDVDYKLITWVDKNKKWIQ